MSLERKNRLEFVSIWTANSITLRKTRQLPLPKAQEVFA